MDQRDANSVVETARVFYDSARAEMLMRIRERDVATYVWLGVLGTILGLAYGGKSPHVELLLVFPPLAMGFAHRIEQHETIIKILADYCKTELGPILEIGNLKQWDNSKALGKRQKSVVDERTILNILLLGGPSTAALILNVLSLPQRGAIWLLSLIGFVCTIATVIFLVRAYKTRHCGALPMDTLDGQANQANAANAKSRGAD